MPSCAFVCLQRLQCLQGLAPPPPFLVLFTLLLQRPNLLIRCSQCCLKFTQCWRRRVNRTRKGGGGANPCKHCRCCKQTKAHEGIEEKNCFLNPAARKWRPPWAKKKLEENNVDYKMEWQQPGLSEKEEHTSGKDSNSKQAVNSYSNNTIPIKIFPPCQTQTHLKKHHHHHWPLSLNNIYQPLMKIRIGKRQC